MNSDAITSQLVLEMSIEDNNFNFASSLDVAIQSAELEIQSLKETHATVKNVGVDCDKLDYALAASSGILCGILDIFLVGKPKESFVGNTIDEWFADRTMDFAKFCGWEGNSDDKLSSAIRFLEQKFKIPYDQRGAGDTGSTIYDLTPTNHHFKSLAHNPTLLGLFVSILDQFTNQAHFVTDGELRALQDADNNFVLNGNSFQGKLYSGFVNWLGHLISDTSGSSGSKGRGMGIPSPFWSWTNDIIVLKKNVKLPILNFDKTFNELALRIYKEGYDIRFQTAQAIPVFINETIVRLVYTTRRMVKFYISMENQEYSMSDLWKVCNPFSNPSVKRMLTVAHGTFCLVELSDATIRSFVTGGKAFNMTEFSLRFNIVGIGRFTISLFGEAKSILESRNNQFEEQLIERELNIVDNYLQGLTFLSDLYDDKNLLNFVDDLRNSDMYVQAFQKSVQLADLRRVPEGKVLRTKSDVDSYFRKGHK